MVHFNFKYLAVIFLTSTVLLGLSTVYYHGAFQRNWANYAAQRIQNGKLEIRNRELEDELALLRKERENGSDARKVERLQRDLKKLHELLDMREQEIGQLEANKLLKEQPPRKSGTAAPRKTYRNYMERLQKENPERYQKIVTRMEEMARQKKKLIEKRDQFFAGIDKEKLTEEQQTLVNDYLTLIQLNNALIEEKNSENRKDIWQNNRLLMQMQEGIREVLLQQEFGDKAKADRVREIYEITSPRAVFGSMGHF